MFKTKKTRQLEQAADLVGQLSKTLRETTDNWQQTVELAKELGELRDRALKCAGTWQRLYEEAIAKSKPVAFTPELEATLDASFLKACGVASLEEVAYLLS
jgi:hypothetical protein